MTMAKTQREIDSESASWSYAELWDKFPIPARPDAEEILVEGRSILDTGKNASDISIMILGSTIEYRSLAQRLGIAPYVVDFSQDNFDSLTAFSKEKFEQEHFVEADWLEITYDSFFDFILGHRPFNVVRHDQVAKLFARMYRALKPGGIFFCRGIVSFADDANQLEQLLDQWAFAKDRQYPLFSYLEVPLYLHCSDSEGYMDYPKARGIVDTWFQSKRISAADYEQMRPLISLPAGTKFRARISKAELESHITNAGFAIDDWIFTSHSFTKNMPIIKLRK